MIRDGSMIFTASSRCFLVASIFAARESSASTTRSSGVKWTMKDSHSERIVNWGFSACQCSSVGTGISCRRRENSRVDRLAHGSRRSAAAAGACTAFLSIA